MGLKDRLARRGLPTAPFALRVEDDSAALAEVERARVALVDNSTEDARARLLDAEKALEACYEQVTLRALSPKDWEDLVSEHKPDDEHKDDPWDRDTFAPAAMARCVDSDITAEDWQEWMVTQSGPLSTGELSALWNAVLEINHRTPDGRIPKG